MKFDQISRVTAVAAAASAALIVGMLTPAGAFTAPAAAQTLSNGRSGLSEFDTLGAILDASYGSLSDRVRPSGFAPTSIKEEGGYSGMFVRDASIQAMAMQAAGESEKARDVLQYIASYGQVKDRDRAPRVLPNESYSVSASLPAGLANFVGQYQTQVDNIAYRVTGGNRIAQRFTLREDKLEKIKLVLWSDAGQTGSVRISIRPQRDSALSEEIAFGERSGPALPTENQTQWQEIPLTVVSGNADRVKADTEMWIVIESASAVRYGLNMANRTVDPLPGINNFEAGSWKTTNHSLAFTINDVPTDNTPIVIPDTVVAAIGADAAIRQTINAGNQLGSLSIALRSASPQPGELVVAISDDKGTERTVTVPASQVAPQAQWMNFTFPAVGIDSSSNNYTFKLWAPQAAPGSIELLGIDGTTAQVPNGLHLADSHGEQEIDKSAAFEAFSLNYNGEDMSNQPDGNYMFVLAWARYINAFPNDTQFVAETYPTVSQWANYYLTSSYWNEALNPHTDKPMNLLYNPEFESSRKHQHLRGYDLITNVFAAQALRELALLADIAGEAPAVVANWQDWVKKIEQGINDNLVVERTVGGQTKKIYREMYWLPAGVTDIRDNASLRRWDGFNWVNLAPVAAQWEGTDQQVLANTYEAYLAEGSHAWPATNGQGPWTMLQACTTNAGPDTDGATCNLATEVITKGLGWEFALVGQLSGDVRSQRMPALGSFVEAHTGSNNLVHESFLPDSDKDPGNQEQTSWWIIGMLEAFPRDHAVVGTDPEILGIAEVNKTLAAHVGTWEPADAILSYQWLIDGTALYGTNDSELTVPASALGKRITVRVTGSKAGFDSKTHESAPTQPVLAEGTTPVDPEPEPEPTRPDPQGPTSISVSVPSVSKSKQVFNSAKARRIRLTATVHGVTTAGRVTFYSGSQIIASAALSRFGAAHRATALVPGKFGLGTYRNITAKVTTTAGRTATSAKSDTAQFRIVKATTKRVRVTVKRNKAGVRPKVTVRVAKLNSGHHATGRVRVLVGKKVVRTVKLTKKRKGRVTVTLPARTKPTFKVKARYVPAAKAKAKSKTSKPITVRVKR